MIERSLQSQVKQLLDFFPCLGILGPRQVGKTTFVKFIKSDLNGELLYMDLENSRDAELLRTNAQWFLEQNADKLIIIDEIQRELSLFPILRSIIDQTNRPGQFILLGSASPELLSKSSETLAGRIVYKELTPLNSLELSEFELKQHWFRGGYPKAFLAPNDEMWFEWHKAYLTTFIEMDLRSLTDFSSPANISRLLKMIASTQGNLLNYSLFSKSLGMSSNTVKNYIDLLEHSFVVRRLSPYYANLGKRLVKSPKLYIRDSGILHSLLDFLSYDELISHPISGNSWEGFIIEQIVSQLHSSCKAYFYRTQSGAELDLCLVKGQKPVVSIEIKLSNQPKLSRGNNQSIIDLTTNHNFLVVFDEANYSLNEDWHVVDLHHLMLKLKELRLLQ